MKNPATPVQFKNGVLMKNRFMLAPLTNTQSHENGQLSEDEFRWLSMRAKGQFGMVMTCASHVQKEGKGFPRQLGIFSDELMEGHKKLTSAIKAHDSLAVIQLQHAGMRSPKELLETEPQCPSDNKEHGARGLTLEEVKILKNDFVSAAVRAKACGYDGVEIHGAHGYILTQFLSSEINKRTDEYGGSLENRARLLFEIVNETRGRCGDDFLLGVRLSPERFGMKLKEVLTVSQQLIDGNKIDFLDISLWDVFKHPVEEEHADKTLLAHFLELDFKDVKFTVAGKIRNGKEVHEVLENGVDFVTIGRSAILHHDFPQKVIDNSSFEPIETPISKSYLNAEGLSDDFVNYMKRWKGFVKE
ncbi:NADH:flavin oxidoreductase [Brumimicrobium salinarum]|uniref:NADH:flavin oxidoreductase n=1 Tax=Brumimicrobium salinarum TaxID=2058658 RepID=A0A2I0R423_9FLAO|nr:NADH:flavin oxidoreductase [Brumimicrobium salinarum]PKR81325.1 NADH:flavin oxidoreductase [Brumimicrobium salinarum]